MTDRIAEERGWIPVFENWNAGVYLRDDPVNAGNLERCAWKDCLITRFRKGFF